MPDPQLYIVILLINKDILQRFCTILHSCTKQFANRLIYQIVNPLQLRVRHQNEIGQGPNKHLSLSNKYIKHNAMIFLKKHYIDTKKGLQFISIHHDVKYAIRDSNIKNGQVNITIPKGNAGLIIIEPLDDVLKGLQAVFENLAGQTPGNTIDKWKQQAAISPRIQSAMIGRSLTIPYADSKLLLDSYDEIHVIDFEDAARRMEISIQIVGDAEQQPQPPQGGRGARPQQAPAKR